MKAFCNKEKARQAGRKVGQVHRPGTRYFAMNREAAAAAGRKSRYIALRPVPVPDDRAARAEFERVSGDYARLVPWEQLAESTRQFWRKKANDLAKEMANNSQVLFKDSGNSTADIDLLRNVGKSG